MTSGTRIVLAAVLFVALSAATCSAAPARVEFQRDFAPAEGWVKPVEQPFRQEVCLNGRWQFQPMPLPKDWKRGTGVPPELAMPAADKWEATPLKVPSPWNVNTWGAGPVAGAKAGALAWQPVTCPSRDRFFFHEMKQPGPDAEPFAVYFSYWICSPRALDDLLAGGPDVPRVTMSLYVSEKCRLFVNGRELQPARTEPADYRTLYVFESVPLKKDWNHFLVKVAARQLRGESPATLAVRIRSSNEEYFRQIETAVELKPAAAK